mmetsp:Transcript_14229/g.32910  ORF Transcript_14229/g.32910 Transcript_14229/m.32910 type:complete len:339 (-) Transcript_14229:274-1290(-)
MFQHLHDIEERVRPRHIPPLNRSNRPSCDRGIPEPRGQKRLHDGARPPLWEDRLEEVRDRRARSVCNIPSHPDHDLDRLPLPFPPPRGGSVQNYRGGLISLAAGARCRPDVHLASRDREGGCEEMCDLICLRVVRAGHQAFPGDPSGSQERGFLQRFAHLHPHLGERLGKLHGDRRPFELQPGATLGIVGLKSHCDRKFLPSHLNREPRPGAACAAHLLCAPHLAPPERHPPLPRGEAARRRTACQRRQKLLAVGAIALRLGERAEERETIEAPLQIEEREVEEKAFDRRKTLGIQNPLACPCPITVRFGSVEVVPEFSAVPVKPHRPLAHIPLALLP